MHDLNDRILSNAVDGVKSNLHFLADQNVIETQDMERALNRISTTTSLTEAVSGADYVQESTSERYAVKKRIFREMDTSSRPDTILASSTSGLLMTEIQKVTRRPERCIVSHPLNPPHLMPLVELVPGKRTSKETVKKTCELMSRVGKVPIVLRREIVGFIANRLQAALWREAIDLVDRGVASVDDVDKAVHSGLGIRWALIGPHLTIHLGGGRGGMESFIEQIGPTFSKCWKDMKVWKKIPNRAARKVIDEVKETTLVRENTLEGLLKCRDSKILEIVRIKSSRGRCQRFSASPTSGDLTKN